MPRGRSYLRHGSVCHLAIKKSMIEALVLGSDLYQVNVAVRALQPKKWDEIKTACGGHIGSLLDLLEGKLSDVVMRKMCDRQNGLFPLDKEMTLQCNCPDWADMCKHVAAVLYGVGARLDEDPQVLFLLRGVNHEDLLHLPTNVIEGTLSQDAERQTMDPASLSEIFGVDIDLGQKDDVAADRKTRPVKPKSRSKSAKSPQTSKRAAATVSKNKKQKNEEQPPLYYTGPRLRKIRRDLGWIQKEFAKELRIGVATLSKLENQEPRRKLALRPEVEEIVHRLWRKSRQNTADYRI
ncbi:MAG: helix-turn-helix domain-containing protein [Myxococcota bacterium]